MANSKQAFERRRDRVRRSVKKAANGRPRLSIFRSSKQIYVPVIDDVAGKTLAAYAAESQCTAGDIGRAGIGQHLEGALRDQRQRRIRRSIDL